MTKCSPQNYPLHTIFSNSEPCIAWPQGIPFTGRGKQSWKFPWLTKVVGKL